MRMRWDCGLEVGRALAVAIRLLSIQAVTHTHGGTNRGCANFTRAAGCFSSSRSPDAPGADVRHFYIGVDRSALKSVCSSVCAMQVVSWRE